MKTDAVFAELSYAACSRRTRKIRPRSPSALPSDRN